MQIKMNGQAVEIFSGATVRDALRKYSDSEWKRVQKNEKKVCDRRGHEVGLDGELSGGEEFFLKECAAKGTRS
jgi:sulfur carrier protein ThiS